MSETIKIKVWASLPGQRAVEETLTVDIPEGADDDKILELCEAEYENWFSGIAQGGWNHV